MTRRRAEENKRASTSRKISTRESQLHQALRRSKGGPINVRVGRNSVPGGAPVTIPTIRELEAAAGQPQGSDARRADSRAGWLRHPQEGPRARCLIPPRPDTDVARTAASALRHRVLRTQADDARPEPPAKGKPTGPKPRTGSAGRWVWSRHARRCAQAAVAAACGVASAVNGEVTCTETRHWPIPQARHRFRSLATEEQMFDITLNAQDLRRAQTPWAPSHVGSALRGSVPTPASGASPW